MKDPRSGRVAYAVVVAAILAGGAVPTFAVGGAGRRIATGSLFAIAQRLYRLISFARQGASAVLVVVPAEGSDTVAATAPVTFSVGSVSGQGATCGTATVRVVHSMVLGHSLFSGRIGLVSGRDGVSLLRQLVARG